MSGKTKKKVAYPYIGMLFDHKKEWVNFMVHGSDLSTAVTGRGSTERPVHRLQRAPWAPPSPVPLASGSHRLVSLSAIRLPPPSPVFGGIASLVVAILVSM